MKLKFAPTLHIFLFCSFSLTAQITFTNHTDLLHNPNGVTSGVAVAVCDMDNDGRDDIVRLDNGNFLNIEYQQAPNADFSHVPITALDLSTAWAMAVADVNNDGIGDVMWGGYYDGVKLVVSENGTNQYTTSSLPGPGLFVQGSNFADIDNDGWLDAFACHDDAESRIWANNGNGNFSNANSWINMATVPSSDNSGNYGSVWTDFDSDGDTDLYIAKCRGGVTDPTDPRRINALFVNDGQGNFSENAGGHGLKIGAQSWTADFQDIDNDGDFDCFIANHAAASQLLENDGFGNFTDISASAGLSGLNDYFIQGIMRDFDNDGFVDILTADAGQLYLNNGDRTFTAVSIPFSDMNSFALGDLNFDGFLDIYAVYQCGYTSPCGVPDQLWMNGGNNHHYLAVRLEGNGSNARGVGARVEIYGSWGVQTREIRAGESYGISNSLTAHFGLGTATQVDSVVVKWPSGTHDVVVNPAINEYLLIEEGLACALPDVAVQMPTFECGGGSTSLQITLCNEGLADLPAGFPVSVFRNDPRQSNSSFLASGQTSMPIPVGGCATVSVPVNLAAGDLVFAVANEDGTSGLPLTNFTGSGESECRFDNNFASATFTHQPPPLDLGADQNLCNVPLVALDAGGAFFAYEWQDGSASQNFTTTQSGQFWLKATDQCGLQVSDTVAIAITQAAPVDLGEDRSICASENTTLSAAGYSTVQWSPALGLSCADCPSPVAAPASTTTFQVTATEGNCVFSDEIQITVNDLPVVNATATDSDCGTPASVSASANGNGGFTFAWSNGAAGSTILPSDTGIYEVTATDVNGCRNTASASVTVHDLMEYTIAPSDAHCPGSPTGSVDLSIQSGFGPFGQMWSDGSDTEDLSGVAAGNYSVTLTDGNGCTSVAMATVGEPEAITLGAEILPIPCHGGTGGILLEAGGGTGAFSFLWSDGSASQNLAGATAGGHAVSVTDANGCLSEASFSLEEPAAITISHQPVPIVCAGGTGSLLIEAAGGTGGLSFQWSGGTASQNLENIPAGAYSLTVTDANLCVEAFDLELHGPAPIETSTAISDIDCGAATANGAVSVSAEGGVPPFHFLWGNESTGFMLPVNAPGEYMATVTDALGCEKTVSAEVGLSGLLTVETESTPVSCHPDNGPSTDGEAEAGSLTGTVPFTWLWGDGADTPTLSGLGEGEYVVTMTDAIGCTGAATATVEAPPALSLGMVGVDLSCFDLPEGEATVSATGGTPNYEYTWADGQTTETATGLSVGTHTVTVTDGNGCVGSASVELISPPELWAEAVANSEILCFDELGEIEAQASGGVWPYVFNWSGAETDSVLTNISAGNYGLTITDANGCTAFSQMEIISSEEILIQKTIIIPATSATENNGAIYLDSISGGNSPYSYLWSNGQEGMNLENIAPGFYSVIIMDANGCEVSASFEVNFSVATKNKYAPNWEAQIYPNPVSNSGKLVLEIKTPLSEKIEMKLYELTGRDVFGKNIFASFGKTVHEINLPETASGIYFLQLMDGEGNVKYLRLVVE